jgi:hypothetical protein
MSGVFQNIDPSVTSPPSTPGECVPPAFGAGGTLAGWRGRWGGQILEDARHSSVLYICKYFVIYSTYYKEVRICRLGLGGCVEYRHQVHIRAVQLRGRNAKNRIQNYAGRHRERKPNVEKRVQRDLLTGNSIQCCGSSMFIPDPDCFYHSGSRIQSEKREKFFSHRPTIRGRP